MNEQRIQEIKNALRNILQQIIQRNSPLSDQEKQVLLQVIQHAGTRIQELRSEPEEAPTAVPEVEPAPTDSAIINGFKYNPKSQELLVKFQDKFPGQNGPTYSYSGVPSYIFDLFSRGAVAPKTTGSNQWHAWNKGIAPSLGGSLWALIRNIYPYERLS